MNAVSRDQEDSQEELKARERDVCRDDQCVGRSRSEDGVEEVCEEGRHVRRSRSCVYTQTRKFSLKLRGGLGAFYQLSNKPQQSPKSGEENGGNYNQSYAWRVATRKQICRRRRGNTRLCLRQRRGTAVVGGWHALGRGERYQHGDTDVFAGPSSLPRTIPRHTRCRCISEHQHCQSHQNKYNIEGKLVSYDSGDIISVRRKDPLVTISPIPDLVP